MSTSHEVPRFYARNPERSDRIEVAHFNIGSPDATPKGKEDETLSPGLVLADIPSPLKRRRSLQGKDGRGDDHAEDGKTSTTSASANLKHDLVHGPQGQELHRAGTSGEVVGSSSTGEDVHQDIEEALEDQEQIIYFDGEIGGRVNFAEDPCCADLLPPLSKAATVPVERGQYAAADLSRISEVSCETHLSKRHSAPPSRRTSSRLEDVDMGEQSSGLLTLGGQQQTTTSITSQQQASKSTASRSTAATTSPSTTPSTQQHHLHRTSRVQNKRGRTDPRVLGEEIYPRSTSFVPAPLARRDQAVEVFPPDFETLLETDSNEEEDAHAVEVGSGDDDGPLIPVAPATPEDSPCAGTGAPPPTPEGGLPQTDMLKNDLKEEFTTALLHITEKSELDRVVSHVLSLSQERSSNGSMLAECSGSTPEKTTPADEEHLDAPPFSSRVDHVKDVKDGKSGSCNSDPLLVEGEHAQSVVTPDRKLIATMLEDAPKDPSSVRRCAADFSSPVLSPPELIAPSGEEDLRKGLREDLQRIKFPVRGESVPLGNALDRLIRKREEMQSRHFGPLVQGEVVPLRGAAFAAAARPAYSARARSASLRQMRLPLSNTNQAANGFATTSLYDVSQQQRQEGDAGFQYHYHAPNRSSSSRARSRGFLTARPSSTYTNNSANLPDVPRCMSARAVRPEWNGNTQVRDQSLTRKERLRFQANVVPRQGEDNVHTASSKAKVDVRGRATSIGGSPNASTIADLSSIGDAASPVGGAPIVHSHKVAPPLLHNASTMSDGVVARNRWAKHGKHPARARDSSAGPGQGEKKKAVLCGMPSDDLLLTFERHLLAAVGSVLEGIREDSMLEDTKTLTTSDAKLDLPTSTLLQERLKSLKSSPLSRPRSKSDNVVKRDPVLATGVVLRDDGHQSSSSISSKQPVGAPPPAQEDSKDSTSVVPASTTSRAALQALLAERPRRASRDWGSVSSADSPGYGGTSMVLVPGKADFHQQNTNNNDLRKSSSDNCAQDGMKFSPTTSQQHAVGGSCEDTNKPSTNLITPEKAGMASVREPATAIVSNIQQICRRHIQTSPPSSLQSPPPAPASSPVADLALFSNRISILERLRMPFRRHNINGVDDLLGSSSRSAHSTTPSSNEGLLLPEKTPSTTELCRSSTTRMGGGGGLSRTNPSAPTVGHQTTANLLNNYQAPPPVTMRQVSVVRSKGRCVSTFGTSSRFPSHHDDTRALRSSSSSVNARRRAESGSRTREQRSAHYVAGSSQHSSVARGLAAGGELKTSPSQQQQQLGGEEKTRSYSRGTRGVLTKSTLKPPPFSPRIEEWCTTSLNTGDHDKGKKSTSRGSFGVVVDNKKNRVDEQYGRRRSSEISNATTTSSLEQQEKNGSDEFGYEQKMMQQLHQHALQQQRSRGDHLSALTGSSNPCLVETSIPSRRHRSAKPVNYTNRQTTTSSATRNVNMSKNTEEADAMSQMAILAKEITEKINNFKALSAHTSRLAEESIRETGRSSRGSDHQIPFLGVQHSTGSAGSNPTSSMGGAPLRPPRCPEFAPRDRVGSSTSAVRTTTTTTTSRRTFSTAARAVATARSGSMGGASKVAATSASSSVQPSRVHTSRPLFGKTTLRGSSVRGPSARGASTHSRASVRDASANAGTVATSSGATTAAVSGPAVGETRGRGQRDAKQAFFDRLHSGGDRRGDWRRPSVQHHTSSTTSAMSKENVQQPVVEDLPEDETLAGLCADDASPLTDIAFERRESAGDSLVATELCGGARVEDASPLENDIYLVQVAAQEEQVERDEAFDGNAYEQPSSCTTKNTCTFSDAAQHSKSNYKAVEKQVLFYGKGDREAKSTAPSTHTPVSEHSTQVGDHDSEYTTSVAPSPVEVLHQPVVAERNGAALEGNVVNAVECIKEENETENDFVFHPERSSASSGEDSREDVVDAEANEMLEVAPAPLCGSETMIMSAEPSPSKEVESCSWNMVSASPQSTECRTFELGLTEVPTKSRGQESLQSSGMGKDTRTVSRRPRDEQREEAKREWEARWRQHVQDKSADPAVLKELLQTSANFEEQLLEAEVVRYTPSSSLENLLLRRQLGLRS